MSRFLMCARLNFSRSELSIQSYQNTATYLSSVKWPCHTSPLASSLKRAISMQNNVHQQQKPTVRDTSSPSSSVPSTSVQERVKETTKTAWYSSVILAGVGVTACILYYIFNELFSRDSANNVYAAALDRCLKENKVIDLLGEPIKGYGEETRRGRRQHVSHLLYEKNGINYMRMKFYLKGSRKQATVHLEMKENSQTKHFEYRYLFVQLDDLSRQVVILEDHRAADFNNSNSLPAFTPLDSVKGSF